MAKKKKVTLPDPAGRHTYLKKSKSGSRKGSKGKKENKK